MAVLRYEKGLLLGQCVLDNAASRNVFIEECTRIEDPVFVTSAGGELSRMRLAQSFLLLRDILIGCEGSLRRSEIVV